MTNPKTEVPFEKHLETVNELLREAMVSYSGVDDLDKRIAAYLEGAQLEKAWREASEVRDSIATKYVNLLKDWNEAMEKLDAANALLQRWLHEDAVHPGSVHYALENDTRAHLAPSTTAAVCGYDGNPFHRCSCAEPDCPCHSLTWEEVHGTGKANNG